MFKTTDTKWAPWYILRSDDKERARLAFATLAGDTLTFTIEDS